VVFSSLHGLANYSWFIGMGIALLLYTALSRRRPVSI